MNNRRYKNWNNFALGLLVMILPLLSLPASLKNLLFAASGFFIALFSLARVGAVNNEQNEQKTPPAPL